MSGEDLNVSWDVSMREAYLLKSGVRVFNRRGIVRKVIFVNNNPKSLFGLQLSLPPTLKLSKKINRSKHGFQWQQGKISSKEIKEAKIMLQNRIKRHTDHLPAFIREKKREKQKIYRGYIENKNCYSRSKWKTIHQN